MKSIAELVTALAALLAAVAWPAAFLVGLLTFRREIRQAIAKVPNLFDRMKSIKIFEIEAELERPLTKLSKVIPAKAEVSARAN